MFLFTLILGCYDTLATQQEATAAYDTADPQ
jgi:hypothetical protein